MMKPSLTANESPVPCKVCTRIHAPALLVEAWDGELHALVRLLEPNRTDVNRNPGRDRRRRLLLDVFEKLLESRAFGEFGFDYQIEQLLHPFWFFPPASAR